MNKEIKNIVPTKKEEAPAVAVQERPQTILTGNDAFIAGTVERQPKIPAQVRDVSKPMDLSVLPREVQENEEVMKKYRFKWIGKSERQVVRATEVEQWVLCTRQNAPFIPASYFKVHGAVEKAGMLLAFMREENAKARAQRVHDKDAARYRKVKLDADKGGGRYKAGLSPGEEETTAGGFQQGRDF